MDTQFPLEDVLNPLEEVKMGATGLMRRELEEENVALRDKLAEVRDMIDEALDLEELDDEAEELDEEEGEAED